LSSSRNIIHLIYFSFNSIDQLIFFLLRDAHPRSKRKLFNRWICLIYLSNTKNREKWWKVEFIYVRIFAQFSRLHSQSFLLISFCASCLSSENLVFLENILTVLFMKTNFKNYFNVILLIFKISSVVKWYDSIKF
jgi:hypothetical protein